MCWWFDLVPQYVWNECRMIFFFVVVDDDDYGQDSGIDIFVVLVVV